MLVDVRCGNLLRRLGKGVYRHTNWNFELEFRGSQIFELDYPDLPGDFPCYGVCDSPKQLMRKLPEEILKSKKPYVISMVRIRKNEQSEVGGWRWHKWGPYIGTQKPTCEYLYDEPQIEKVWTYHIYLLGQSAEEAKPYIAEETA